MKAYFFILLLLLSGCTGYTHSMKERELNRYQDQVHVPINVLLQMHSYFDTTLYNPLEDIYANIVESRRFHSVSPGYVGGPYALEINFSIIDSSSAAETVGSILAAATLFIVPHQDTRTYQIELKLFEHGSLKYSQTYSNTMKGAVSVANSPLDGIQESVNLIVSEMLYDIEVNNLIPLMTKPNNKNQNGQ